MTSVPSPDSSVFVLDRIRTEVGVDLDDKAEKRLRRIIARAEDRAQERSHTEYERAVDILATKLPEGLLQVRRERDTHWDRRVSVAELKAAFRLICPLWPFCK